MIIQEIVKGHSYILLKPPKAPYHHELMRAPFMHVEQTTHTHWSVHIPFSWGIQIPFFLFKLKGRDVICNDLLLASQWCTQSQLWGRIKQLSQKLCRRVISKTYKLTSKALLLGAFFFLLHLLPMWVWHQQTKTQKCDPLCWHL